MSLYIYICVSVCRMSVTNSECSIALLSFAFFPISLVRFDVFLYDFFFCCTRSFLVLYCPTAIPYKYIYILIYRLYMWTFFTLSNSKRYRISVLDVFFMYAHTTLYTTWYKSHWGDIFMSFCTNVCFADPKNQMDVPYSIYAALSLSMCVYGIRV